jgi:hypothetical protein
MAWLSGDLSLTVATCYGVTPREVTEGHPSAALVKIDDIIDAINGEPCSALDHRIAVDLIRVR